METNVIYSILSHLEATCWILHHHHHKFLCSRMYMRTPHGYNDQNDKNYPHETFGPVRIFCNNRATCYVVYSPS